MLNTGGWRHMDRWSLCANAAPADQDQGLLWALRVRRSHVRRRRSSGSSLSKRENATRVAVTGGESEGRKVVGHLEVRDECEVKDRPMWAWL